MSFKKIIYIYKVVEDEFRKLEGEYIINPKTGNSEIWKVFDTSIMKCTLVALNEPEILS